MLSSCVGECCWNAGMLECQDFSNCFNLLVCCYIIPVSTVGIAVVLIPGGMYYIVLYNMVVLVCFVARAYQLQLGFCFFFS